MFDMVDADFSPLKMFSTSQSAYFDPQPTISLADTDLLAAQESDYSRTQESTPDISQEDGMEEKKTMKKRKSWGQELPIPKTNLPPRKRAKTEDEKEQRRIERVLRNRAAAQSSRERKRQEVEKLEGEKKAIEQENIVLRQRVLQIEQEKWKLQQQLSAVTSRLGGSINIENITPPPLSPEMSRDMYRHHHHIKTEPADHHGLPSPDPSSQGVMGPGSISDGHRSRSASLQSEMLPQHNHIDDVVPRPAVSVTDGDGVDAPDAVANNLPDGSMNKAMINEKKIDDNDDDKMTSTKAASVMINVNGETIETASPSGDIVLDLATPAPISASDQEQEQQEQQESASATFDALINELSPPTSSVMELTPSPEAPSLSFFEESFSAGSPNEELLSPGFSAFTGDFDFSLDFGATGGKNEIKLDDTSLLFAPLDSDLLNFDQLAQNMETGGA